MEQGKGTVPRDRLIQDEASLARWTGSGAHEALTAFLRRCNQAVEGRRVSEVASMLTPGPLVVRLLAMLDQVQALLEAHPPQAQSQRFGNKAHRDFVAAVHAAAPALVRAVLPAEEAGYERELAPYLVGSLGNPTRLDYGTGHELSFCIFLLCLDRLGLFAADDYAFLPLVVYNKYLGICRAFQRLYSLEPAGSHGVWSLDDYQFLCFLWGSAQLLGQTEIKPISVVDKALVKRHADEYLYCAAIDYIHVCKTGPFFEHSPTLNNIAGVVSWEKINGGMFKMYEAEVLRKIPIMQHVMFGSLFPFPE